MGSWGRMDETRLLALGETTSDRGVWAFQAIRPQSLRSHWAQMAHWGFLTTRGALLYEPPERGGDVGFPERPRRRQGDQSLQNV
jgi:hypothetical protein